MNTPRLLQGNTVVGAGGRAGLIFVDAVLSADDRAVAQGMTNSAAVTGALLFLLSGPSRFTAGQTLVVDDEFSL
jgi:hypothetical protein